MLDYIVRYILKMINNTFTPRLPGHWDMTKERVDRANSNSIRATIKQKYSNPIHQCIEGQKFTYGGMIGVNSGPFQGWTNYKTLHPMYK